MTCLIGNNLSYLLFVDYLGLLVQMLMFLVLLIRKPFLAQKLKTSVVKRNVNPEWNEDLTLSISDPNLPITLVRSFALFSFVGPAHQQFYIKVIR